MDKMKGRGVMCAMIKKTNFLKQYFKAPRTIGAVAPSSKWLAEKMVGDIDFENANCIVEYGPGTGVFTEKLLEKKKPDTILFLLETNKEFCTQLRKKYESNHSVIIVYGSAEHVDSYLKKYGIKKVDYIVSGLPFTSLPKDVSEEILLKTRNLLGKDGMFITFQYTLLKKALFDRFFEKIEHERVYLNIPPAYVLKCQRLQ